jgi:hypothetical protein
MFNETEYRKKKDAKWRTSEYVVAYAEWGDRGRMRGSNCSPDAVLHRPSCGTLNEERRLNAVNPAAVYATTLEEFTRDANHSGSSGVCRVCQLCCRDVKVTGCRMKQPKPTKAPSGEFEDGQRKPTRWDLRREAATQARTEALKNALRDCLAAIGSNDSQREFALQQARARAVAALGTDALPGATAPHPDRQ